MTANNLKQCRILLLRQTPDNKTLKDVIESQKGKVFQWQALQIEELKQTSTQEKSNNLLTAKKHIFISKPAAVYGVKLIKSNNNTKIFTVGSGTATVLAEAGMQKVKFPKKATSEGLLEMEEMQQVDSENIVIYKGVGGRDKISLVLKQRGAKVVNFELYSRSPTSMTEPQADEIRIFKPNYIQITSNAIAESLDKANQKFKLFNKETTQMLVVSERIEKRMREKGYKKIVCIDSMQTEETIKAIKKQL